MVRPDFAKWGQSLDEIRRLAIEAPHPRTRERFHALYMIGSGQKTATQWAQETQRQPRTVIRWMHRYNAQGPDALSYQQRGGRRTLLSPEEQEQIAETVKSSRPLEHELPGHGWTLKKLQRWVASKLGKRVSRNTLRTLLKAAGFSWKKCKKLLAKADPEQRAAFVEQFQALYERLCQGEIRLLYVDESHFHPDLDLGYTWAPTGEPAWRQSSSPSLSARLNWYGAYDFTEGRCFIWEEGKCNGDHTVRFLEHLAAWLQESERQVVIIWDGASWHRSRKVQAKARELGIHLLPLPGYGPDLNPIEPH